MIALLAGPIGKYLGYAALAAGLLFAAWWVVQQHDARVVAEQQVAERTAQIAQMQADHARVVTALETDKAAAEARAADAISIRKSINVQPSAGACVRSPGYRALRDGLFPAPVGNAGAAGGGAGNTVRR